MKHFKKRTIALVLASVVTVVGSFAAESYKNSLMALTFDGTPDGSVNMLVETRMSYSGNVTPIKKDANTYILMLPEMNSQAPTPDLQKVSGNISSVNIRTMPYSANGKGYTRITIKTMNPTMSLAAQNKVYIASEHKTAQALPQNSPETRNRSAEMLAKQARAKEAAKERQEKLRQKKFEEEKAALEYEMKRKAEKEAATKAAEEEAKKNIAEESFTPETTTESRNYNSYNSSSSNYSLLLALSILIILSSAFFYLRAKNKMQELAGGKIEIDIDDKKEKHKKISKIKNTIKTLDSTYPNPAAMKTRSEYTQPALQTQVVSEAVEELNIVDLDQIFNEHKVKNSIPNMEDEENQALEDFLSGFSFDEDGYGEQIEENTEPEQNYDEEFYEKTITDNSLNFSKDDISCINQLLNTEINDDTLRNINQYAVSNPVKTVVPKQKVLEDLVTTYTISQNVLFTKDDINVLYKLISVELDEDFVTDLRTNPERMIEMQKEMEERSERQKKPSEIITLSVKDMLPDLSEELRRQGNKKIESEYKPETVYFSEGYEVSTLSLNDTLPDLSAEINNDSAYVSKPSAEIEYVDTSYEVQRLNISNMLPDLNEALANPDKYAESEPKEIVVDEESLLKNISNVQFKPFYDGTEEFEVLNDFEENTPSVSDIQKELSQFNNFEITEEENIEPTNSQDEYDDFAALYDNEYVDLDNPEGVNEIIANEENSKVIEAPKTVLKEEPKQEEFVPIKLERKVERVVPKTNRPQMSEDLLRKIEETRTERELRKARISNNQERIAEKNKKPILDQPVIETSIKCIWGGESYNVISTATFEGNAGCHLAKNSSGYTVLGYVGDALCVLKQYESLKSERIQIRLSERLDDGTLRYLVRIGLNKFIIDLKDNNIKYVMDLC